MTVRLTELTHWSSIPDDSDSVHRDSEFHWYETLVFLDLMIAKFIATLLLWGSLTWDTDLFLPDDSNSVHHYDSEVHWHDTLIFLYLMIATQCIMTVSFTDMRHWSSFIWWLRLSSSLWQWGSLTWHIDLPLPDDSNSVHHYDSEVH